MKSDFDAAETVLAMQSGDEEAFGKLYVRYREYVMKILLAKGCDFPTAEDLCQQVFLQARRKIGQLEKPGAIRGWLRTMARRMLINHVVRQKEQCGHDYEYLLNRHFSREKEPSEALSDREQGELVAEGVRSLGEMDRLTLDAFYFRGRSILQMADEFEAPRGTIKRRLHVARRRLASTAQSKSFRC